MRGLAISKRKKFWDLRQKSAALLGRTALGQSGYFCIAVVPLVCRGRIVASPAACPLGCGGRHICRPYGYPILLLSPQSRGRGMPRPYRAMTFIFPAGGNHRLPYKILPLPTTTSPSYKTTVCPGVMARCGASKTTSALPSPSGRTVAGCSGWR